MTRSLQSKLSNLFKRKAVIRTFASVALVLLFLTSGIGYLHTSSGRKLPWGRKVLGWMGVQCPLDSSKLSAEQVESSRQQGVRALRGKSTAPARPALSGLVLDQTTEAEARGWAYLHGIDCKSQSRGMKFLKCGDVPPGALPSVPGQTPIHMLSLAFNPSGKLIAVDVFRRSLGAQEASRVMRELTARLQTSLGNPTESLGEISEKNLAGNSMKTALVHYRFRDYLAMLTATNIPWSGGIAVHEQYSSAVLTKR